MQHKHEYGETKFVRHVNSVGLSEFWIIENPKMNINLIDEIAPNQFNYNGQSDEALLENWKKELIGAAPPDFDPKFIKP